MNVTVTLFGKTYRRDYEQHWCALPGCNKRVPFRVRPDGSPEGADKQRGRETCCQAHGRALHALRLRESLNRSREQEQSTPGVAAPGLFDAMQAWLCGRRVV